MTFSDPDFSVLDVGCGRGRLLTSLAEKGLDVVGIDINKDDVRTAKITLERRKLGAGLLISDAENLPFRNSVFDKFVLYALLEHLDNPIKCLKESVRVAEGGACFEIAIPVEARDYIVDLKLMLLEFPFGVLRALKRSLRRYKYRRIPGWGHKNRIQPRHISPLLEIKSMEIRRHSHSWCAGRKGKLLKRIFGLKPLKIGVYRVWHIKAIKKFVIVQRN